MKKLSVLFLSLLLLLSGCGGGILDSAGVRPDNALYFAGDASIAGDVTSVDVSWSAGEVEILYADTDQIDITETAEKELTEAQAMRWCLEGNKLTVKFCAAGNILSLPYEKKLTLTLPADRALSLLSVDTASGEIRGEGLTADTLRLSTASGAVDVSIGGALKAEIDTASGSASVRSTASLPELDIETASGSISCSLSEVQELHAETASGRIGVSLGASKDASFDSSSGNMELRFGSAPKECEIDTASGSVTVFVPADAGFTAEIDTASGDVESDIPMKMNGDTWICGDGSARWEIETASGNVTFRAE